MEIPLFDLKSQYREIQSEIDFAIKRVLNSGNYILGSEVENIENQVANYLTVKFAIGVASGTDALILSLRGLEIGVGDEVIVPAYTFFATVGAILSVGSIPVFVDIDPLTYLLDINHVASKINSKTKAIIPVHLYGHPVNMKPLIEMADYHNLKIIEDNAQAFGAMYEGVKTGSFGDVGCLSFFPTKNLGGYGDGGMVVTNDREVFDRVRQLRNHGWKRKYFPETVGYNSRLDALQAAILGVKIKYVDQWTNSRRRLAEVYGKLIDPHIVTIPYEAENIDHAFHLYVLRSKNRDKLQEFLNMNGVSTGVYYPQPPYLAQPCSKFGYEVGDFPISDQASREVISIPLFAGMTSDQVYYISSLINNSVEP